jgi:hypothetical protein
MTAQQPDKPFPLVKIYGRRGSSHGYKIRDFLHRCDIAFEWVELGSDEAAREVGVQQLNDPRLPKFGVELLLARKGVRAEFVTGKGVDYLEDGTRITAHASAPCATTAAT